MKLTAVDPALLIYSARDWEEGAQGCYERLDRLLLHRDFVRDFQQRLAMSTRLSAAIMQHFPWDVGSHAVPAVRDLRQVILEDLSRQTMIDAGEGCESEPLSPDVACAEMEDAEVKDAWAKLLAGCVLASSGAGEKPRIATWASVEEELPPAETKLTVLCDSLGGLETRSIGVVWDEPSWYSDLALEDWWPDLHRCVLLLFATSPSLRTSEAQHEPWEFSVTSQFHKDVEKYCLPHALRRALVESITKLVHGIHDKGLGDEPFKEVRRFRVTRFWRVHYRREGSALVLLEFGPHDIGI